MARPLDGERKLPLMLGASSRHPPGYDLPLLGGELYETFVVLIIDIDVTVFAESADFSLLYFFYRYQFLLLAICVRCFATDPIPRSSKTDRRNRL